MGRRQPLVRQPTHPRPRHAVFLAASFQRTSLQVDDMVSVRPNCLGIGRHSVVREIARDH